MRLVNVAVGTRVGLSTFPELVAVLGDKTLSLKNLSALNVLRL
jgi:hypothetical protein